MEHWNISISPEWKLQASKQVGSCPETQSKDVRVHSSLAGLLVPRSSQSLCASFTSPFHLSQTNSVFTGTFTFKGNPAKLLGSSLLLLHTDSFSLDTFYVKTNFESFQSLSNTFRPPRTTRHFSKLIDDAGSEIAGHCLHFRLNIFLVYFPLLKTDFFSQIICPLVISPISTPSSYTPSLPSESIVFLSLTRKQTSF